MRGAVLHSPGDVRVENRPDPTIEQPTDAIIRLVAACVCGSDLWPYRGIEPIDEPRPMGHEYVGVVEEVGSDVRNVEPGEFVVGSFFASDNTCEICQAGYQSRCVHGEFATPTGKATGKDADTRTQPWGHLDIAGPAWHDGGAYGYTVKGGTGFGVPTLVEFARGYTA